MPKQPNARRDFQTKSSFYQVSNHTSRNRAAIIREPSIPGFFAFCLVFLTAFFIFSSCSKNPSDPGPTATATITPTISPTFTISETATVSPTATVTPTNTTEITEIGSNTGEDGWLTSSGTIYSGVTVTAGHFANFDNAQGFLSFTLPAIPSQVISAKLQVKCSELLGDPFWQGFVHAAHFAADYLPLDAADYASPAALTSIGSIPTAAAGSWCEIDVTASVESDRLASLPKSQFRLYFTNGLPNNFQDDLISFWCAGATAAGDRPKLIIEY